MSQFMLCSVKITNADASILRRAVELLAQKNGWTVVNEIRDFYGRTRNDIVAAIRNGTFTRGVGFIISGGQVMLVGDFHLVPSSAIEELRNLIVQYYAAAALENTLQEAGYACEVDVVGEKIVVRGVAW